MPGAGGTSGGLEVERVSYTHRKKHTMGMCKYCKLSTPGPRAICKECERLLKEHERNGRNGVCHKCKGNGENLDGTPCDNCEGRGIIRR